MFNWSVKSGLVCISFLLREMKEDFWVKSVD